MPTPNENLLNLHKNISARDPKFTMTYDAFEAKMQDEGNRKSLYKNLSQRDPDFKMEYEDFTAKMGYGVDNGVYNTGENGVDNTGEKPNTESGFWAAQRNAWISKGRSIQYGLADQIHNLSDEKIKEDIFKFAKAGIIPLQSENPADYDNVIQKTQEQISDLQKAREPIMSEVENKKRKEIQAYKDAPGTFRSLFLGKPGILKEDLYSDPEITAIDKQIKELNDITKAALTARGILVTQGQFAVKKAASDAHYGDENEWGERTMKKAADVMRNLPEPVGFMGKAGSMVPDIAGSAVGAITAIYNAPAGAAIIKLNMATMAAQSYGSTLFQIDEYAKETGKEIDEDTRQMVAVGGALVEGITEYVRIPGITAPMKKMSGQMAKRLFLKEAIKNPTLAVDMVKGFVGKNTTLAKRLAAGLWDIAKLSNRQGLEEAAEEAVSSIGQDFLSYAYLNPEDTPGFSEMLSNATNAAKMAYMTGPVFGSINKYGKYRNVRQARQSNGFVTLIADNKGNTFEGLYEKDNGDYVAADINGSEKTIKADEVGEISRFGTRDFERLTAMAKKGQEASAELYANAELDLEHKAIESQIKAKLYQGQEQHQLMVNGVEQENAQVIITVETIDGNQYQVIDGFVNKPEPSAPIIGIDLKTGEKTIISPINISKTDVVPADQMRAELRAEAQNRIKDKYQLQSIAAQIQDEFQPGDIVTFNGQEAEIVDVTDPTQGVSIKITDAKGGEQVFTIAPDQLGALQNPDQGSQNPDQPTHTQTFTVGKKKFNYTESEDGVIFIEFEGGKDESKAIIAEVDDTKYDVKTISEEVPIPDAPPFAKVKTRTVAKGLQITPKAAKKPIELPSSKPKAASTEIKFNSPVNTPNGQGILKERIQGTDIYNVEMQSGGIKTFRMEQLNQVTTNEQGTAVTQEANQPIHPATEQVTSQPTQGAETAVQPSAEPVGSGTAEVATPILEGKATNQQETPEITPENAQDTPASQAPASPDVNNLVAGENGEIKSEIDTALDEFLNAHKKETGEDVRLRVQEDIDNAMEQFSKARTNKEHKAAIEAIVKIFADNGLAITISVHEDAESVIAAYEKLPTTSPLNAQRVADGFRNNNANAFYDQKSGTIFICASNTTSFKVAVETIVHESCHNGTQKSGKQSLISLFDKVGLKIISKFVPKWYISRFSGDASGKAELSDELVSYITEKLSADKEFLSAFITGQDLSSFVGDYLSQFKDIPSNVILEISNTINKTLTNIDNNGSRKQNPNGKFPLFRSSDTGRQNGGGSNNNVNGEISATPSNRGSVKNGREVEQGYGGSQSQRDVRFSVEEDQAESLSSGIKLVNAYIKSGVYKFSDIVNSLASKGIKISDGLLMSLKKAYASIIVSQDIDGIDNINTVKNYKVEIPPFNTKQPEIKEVAEPKQPTTAGAKMEQILNADPEAKAEQAKAEAEKQALADKKSERARRAAENKAKRKSLNLEQGDDAYTAYLKAIESGDVTDEALSNMTDHDYIMRFSSNPLEILNAINKIDHYIPENQLDKVEAAIAAHMTKVPPASAARFGDRNAFAMNMARSYFAKKGETSLTLDQIAQLASGVFGDYSSEAVTPDDVWNFILKYPNGVNSFYKQINPEYKELKDKFYDLTGVDISSTIFERAKQIMAEKDQASPIPTIEDFLGMSPDDMIKLEKEYEDFINENQANDERTKDEGETGEVHGPGTTGIRDGLPEEGRKTIRKPVQEEKPGEPTKGKPTRAEQIEIAKKGDKVKFTLGGKDYTLPSGDYKILPDGRITFDLFGQKTLKPGEYSIVPQAPPKIAGDNDVSDNALNEPEESYQTKGGDNIRFRLTLDADTETEVTEVAKKKSAPSSPSLRKLKKGEFSRVEMKYSEDKNFIFDGRNKIESPDDVAYLLRQLETKSVENMFATLVAKDGTTTVIHLSMGGRHATIVDFGILADAIHRFKPAKVFLAHNHPSGNLEPSTADINIHARAIAAFGDVIQEHIIIDTTRGEYASFREGVSDYSISDRRPNPLSEPHNYKVIKLDEAIYNTDPSLPTNKIKSSRDVASFLTGQRFSSGGKMSAIILARSNAINAYLHLPSIKLDTDKGINKLHDLLQAYAGRFGGSGIILSGTIPTSAIARHYLTDLKSRLAKADISLLDYIEVASNIAEAKSMADDGLLEPPTEYKAPTTAGEKLEQILGENIGKESKDESPTINESFDKFFQTIETKTDEDGNEILFRTVSPSGFYSTVESALETIKQDKGTPEQFKAMLLKNGAKQAELDWMGFDEFSQDKKSLTKAEIQEWINQNRIEVQEVVKSDKGVVVSDLDQLTSDQRDELDQRITNYPEYEEINDLIDGANVYVDKSGAVLFDESYVENQEQYEDNYDKVVDLLAKINSKIQNEIIGDVNTKYSQYQLPGAENYKELLLVMPEKSKPKPKLNVTKESWEYGNINGEIKKIPGDIYQVYRKGKEFFKAKNLSEVKNGLKERISDYYGLSSEAKDEFKSYHFDEPNILAHIRFNERTVNGEKVLFVEEIQSDFSQSLRKKEEEFKELLKKNPEKVLDMFKKSGKLEVLCP